MPSPSARSFAGLFALTFANNGNIKSADLRKLRAAKTAIADPKERAFAEEVCALIRDDRELDRIEVRPAKHALSRLLGLESTHLPLGLERALKNAVPGSNADVERYELSFDLTQDGPVIPARARIRLVSKAPEQLVFEVEPDRLRIDSVRADRKVVPFEVTGERLFVRAPGAKKIDVRYGVRPTEDPNGHGLIFDRKTGNFSTFTWPYDTGALFPSNSSPNDGARARVKVKLKDGQRLVGANTDGKKPIRIDHPIPAPTIAFYAGKFTDELSIKSKCGVTVSVHGHGKSVRTDVRKAYLKSTVDAIDFFSGWLGRYPFGDRFELVEVKGILGGMEHVGAVALMIESIRNRADARETAVHETAHQWFGDNLRIENSGEFWMSEGFTNYLTFRFFQKADGDLAFYKLLDRGKNLVKEALRHRSHALTGPSYTDVREIFTDIPYELGPWILRMLETSLGRPSFDAMLAAWYRTHRFSPVDTKEFLEFVKKETGHDYSAMFEAWSKIECVPAFRDKSRIDGARVELELKAKTAFPPGMLVPVVLEGARGERMTVSIDPRKPMTVDAGFTVKRLRWDPERRVLADVAS